MEFLRTTTRTAMNPMYKAFVSYSHAADGKLSPAIQSGLHRFAKAWFQRRAMRVFRDETSLSANPALWESIEKALEASEYFLLLASPQAAQSPWVRREIDWWLEHRPRGRLLILLTHGDLVWDSAAGDFDWSRTTALPEDLRRRFTDEPLYVDLRWADDPDKLTLRHTQFRAAILSIAATLRGVPKDELDGEDVRQQRRTRMLAATMVAAILVFAIAAAFQTHVATVERKIAADQRDTALSRLLAARSLKSSTDAFPHLDLALLEGVAAYRIQPTDEAQRSMVTALTQTNGVKKFVRTPGVLVGLAPSPDGKTIATGDTQGHIIFWDAQTLQPELTLESDKGSIRGLAFSPGGHTLAAVYSAQLVLWRLSGGKATQGQTLTARRQLDTVAWSPDGTTLYFTDTGIRHLVVASGVELAPIGADVDLSLRRLAVSPDGRKIATAGDDPAITLWDSATGRSVQTLHSRSATVTSLAFNRDGSLLASGGDDGITLWNVPRGSIHATLQKQPAAAVDSIAFSEDGSVLAAGNHDNTVALWDLKTREASDIRLGPTNGVLQLVFRPGGAELVSSGFEETFIVWNLRPKQGQMLAGHRGSVADLSVSPDGTLLASASKDGTIKLWDLASGRERALLTGHQGEVRAIAFNPASGMLASGGEDRTIRFWDPESGQVREQIQAHGEVESLAISPDGTILAWAASGTSPIFLWDIASRKERGELHGHDLNARSLEFSRHGDLLVSAGDSTIRVWDPRSARQLVEPIEVDSVLKATISPDGRTIASSQNDGPVLLWSVGGNQDPVEIPTQYSFAKHTLAFSPDGRMLVYSDGEADLSLVLRLLGKGNTTWILDMPASVESLAFTRDGKRLVTGHTYGQIALWDTDVERWPERVCEIANRNLTHAEWKELVSDALPYRPVCPDLAVPQD